ncbi:hypothetical protein RMCBS344292_04996 [Rhizopus microsporus]|nr:hypothetical protein RMCBS344292_04996 [Rhizopus microsporus]
MKGERLISKELSFTPYDVKWFPLSSRLCVVGATKKGTGQIAVYGLAGKHVELKVEAETNSVVRCAAITGQARHVTTGDFEGQIQTWDPQKLDVPLTSIKGHESIVNCMSSLNQTISEIATGSRDGCVKMWDTRQPEKAVLTIRSNSKKDIWAVAFGWLRNSKVLAVGYEDGLVQLFDVNGSQYLWNTQLKDGVCSIDFLNDKLLVSTLNGAYKINIESGKIEQVQTTKDTTLWCIRHIPNTEHFTIADGNGKLSTYKDTNLDNILNISKHPIISLDWNKDKKGLFACCAFDKTINIGIIQ